MICVAVEIAFVVVVAVVSVARTGSARRGHDRSSETAGPLETLTD